LSLLPKKLADYRTVATMNSLWRLLLAVLSEDLRQWDDEYAEEFDTAKKGSPIGCRVFAMGMDAAIASALNQCTAQVLWDIASFFEKITPGSMAAVHRRYRMPSLPLVMATWSHAAPRLMKSNNCAVTKTLTPSWSIVTGCSTSMSIARAIVKGPLQESQVQGVVQAPHADDVAQQCQGTEEEVIHKLFLAGTNFADGIVKQGHAMSSKSVILASSDRIARKLQSMFCKAGYKLQIRKSGEHLGHMRVHKQVSQFSLAKGRFARAARRNARGKLLAKKDDRAKMLFRTGVAPQALYGTDTVGLSKTLQRKIHSLGLGDGLHGATPLRNLGQHVGAWQVAGSRGSLQAGRALCRILERGRRRAESEAD
jgi:hypothetical protein